MLNHPTLDKLQKLKLTGMAAALADQTSISDIDELDFMERLGLLVDREATEREDRRLTARLRLARFRHNAAMEDIDYRAPRGLDRGLMQSLAACRWVADHLNILITGPTGVGKTWIACALAQKACREGYHARYVRFPALLRDLAVAKRDGRYPKLLSALARVDVLLIDDWGLEWLFHGKLPPVPRSKLPPSPRQSCHFIQGTFSSERSDATVIGLKDPGPLARSRVRDESYATHPRISSFRRSPAPPPFAFQGHLLTCFFLPARQPWSVMTGDKLVCRAALRRASEAR